MMMSLFEDETFENFMPLTYTRPVFKLKSGIFSFLERVQKVFLGYPLLLLRKRMLHGRLYQNIPWDKNLHRHKDRRCITCSWLRHEGRAILHFIGKKPRCKTPELYLKSITGTPKLSCRLERHKAN